MSRRASHADPSSQNLPESSGISVRYTEWMPFRRSGPCSMATTRQSPRPPKNDRYHAENQRAATQTRQNELIGTATVVLVEARGRHSHGGGNTNEHEKENVVDDRDPHARGSEKPGDQLVAALDKLIQDSKRPKVGGNRCEASTATVST